MPRTKRRIVPGVIYHLISRFVDREWFISDEHERATYLQLIGTAIAASSWRCLGHAVMSNHIHLAMVASDQPLADWIRKPNSAFADWMNRTHDRIGSVFVRGPKSILVPDSRVGQLLAYIHNNPVRAKVVNAPAESTWTSHRFYTDRSKPAPSWLRVDEGLRRIGCEHGATFDAYVRGTTSHPVLGDVESDVQFLEKLEAYERDQVALFSPPPPRRPQTATLVRIAAAHSGLTPEQLCSKRRGIAEQRARAAVSLCGARLGLTRGELASAMNITPQGVSKMQSREPPPSAVQELAARVMAKLDEESVAKDAFDCQPATTAAGGR